MDGRELTVTGEYLGSLDHGADWRAEIEAFADDHEIDAGWFWATGAVQDAEIWYYDQTDREYRSVSFDEPLEVASCVGTVARLDGERFVDPRVVLARPSGQSLAGHLDAATTFAGECYLRAFAEPLEREYDEATGLDLWR
ncbi:MAG: PPC domain-containing DNA-binding protein [Haloferacaceae archaeon]